jgi:glycosyltransferase involved in cell wall biosynthesis
LQKAEAVITICPDLFDYVNSIIADPRKHFLIENSIFDPVRLSHPASTGTPGTVQEAPLPPLAEGKKRIVYAGTLEAYQGIDLLLQAFARLSKENQEAILLIVGGRPEQVERYRKMAKGMGLKERCLFTGQVPQTLAKQYTARADVLVSPRSQGTNTPLKIYEQLQSGIPLVATAIYSQTQVLTPEVAFLVKPEPEDLARGLLTALKDDRAGREKSARAKALYEERYARQVYKNKMKQLLEHLGSCAA